MGKTWRLPDRVISLLLVAALAAIWIAFAPAKIGGQVSYVMVNGNSMEPGFHKGDLAIVRQAAAFQVGDIITYHNAEMKADVIHRIIGTEQDLFITKGDNNSWIDPYHPARDEIVGKLWIHLPQLGAVVEWIKSPLNLALAAGLLGGFFMFNMTPKKSKKNYNQKKQATGNFGGMFETALYAFGILALACTGLAIFAFTLPLMQGAEKIKYEQTGVFSYTAAGTPGVYDGDSVSSGEPVFTKLTCAIDLGFDYTLAGKQLENTSGDQQLYALLSDEGSGWQKTLPLNPVTTFSGGTYATHASLDLCQVQALVAGFEKQTGFRFGSNTLIIVAQVSVVGKLSGQELRDSFEPRLVFKFDTTHFYLAKGASGKDSLKVSQTGSLTNPDMEENLISLAGMAFTTRNLRAISIAGLALSLVGLGGVGWKFNSAVTHSRAFSIRLKYGNMLVNVVDRNLEWVRPVVDVTSIADLARLAERQNLNILHMQPVVNRPIHSYFVQNNEMIYRFVTSDTYQNGRIELKNSEFVLAGAKIMASIQTGVQTRLLKAYEEIMTMWKNWRASELISKIFARKVALQPSNPEKLSDDLPFMK